MFTSPTDHRTVNHTLPKTLIGLEACPWIMAGNQSTQIKLIKHKENIQTTHTELAGLKLVT